jgi:acetyl esterase/lipase
VDFRFLALVLASSNALLAQAPDPPKIPASVIAERDVEYSAVGGSQTLDIIRPRAAASNGPRPAVLLVHGGGFRAGSKEGYIPLAIKLAERG